jgi:acetoin utilization deacetylase AcuC-like enzyme
MKIIFNNEFYNDYENNSSSQKGRMESIINEIRLNPEFEIINCHPANENDVLNVHDLEYYQKVKFNKNIYDLAMLSAGGAIKASEMGMSGIAAFACIKPPGHHAYRDSGWGYCHFSNMAIALQKLRKEGRIKSAFVLDFDAHTGDGTINCLSDWKECHILNPMAEDRKEYLKKIEDFTKNIEYVDIVAVCAGFDSYELDVGKKLTKFDFYVIGRMMKQLAKRFGHNRRFATLEGGYYLPHLGKNVVSFLEGFNAKF